MDTWIHRWELHYRSPTQTPFYRQHPLCDPTPTIPLQNWEQVPYVTAHSSTDRLFLEQRESGLGTAPKWVRNSNASSFHWAPFVSGILQTLPHFILMTTATVGDHYRHLPNEEDELQQGQINSRVSHLGSGRAGNWTKSGWLQNHHRTPLRIWSMESGG